MSDGWLSANGFVGNRKNVHALIKEGWTSGSRVDLGCLSASEQLGSCMGGS